MARTSVSKTEYVDSDGNERTQYRTTVPKDLADGFNLDEKKLDWEIQSGNKIVLTIIDG